MAVGFRWLWPALSRRRLSPTCRGPVSPPRSSNRTCGFPASGSPTGFTSRPTAWSKVHADEVQDAKLPEHNLGWEALRASPLNLATMDEEVADAVVGIVVDRPVGLPNHVAGTSAYPPIADIPACPSRKLT